MLTHENSSEIFNSIFHPNTLDRFFIVSIVLIKSYVDNIHYVKLSSLFEDESELILSNVWFYLSSSSESYINVI